MIGSYLIKQLQKLTTLGKLRTPDFVSEMCVLYLFEQGTCHRDDYVIRKYSLEICSKGLLGIS